VNRCRLVFQKIEGQKVEDRAFNLDLENLEFQSFTKTPFLECPKCWVELRVSWAILQSFQAICHVGKFPKNRQRKGDQIFFVFLFMIQTPPNIFLVEQILEKSELKVGLFHGDHDPRRIFYTWIFLFVQHNLY